jgi:hypothetical protein
VEGTRGLRRGREQAVEVFLEAGAMLFETFR